ncbi:MAG: HEAT repeat domain-containing protein [bacterium]
MVVPDRETVPAADEADPGTATFEPAEDPAAKLLEALASDDHAARLAAADKLAATGEKRAIEPMLQAFKGCDEACRHHLARLLAGMGRIARIVLVQALEDPDPGIRAGAAEALGVAKFFAAAAAKKLSGSLYDPDPTARRSAAEALDRFGWRPHGEAAEAARLVALNRWDDAIAIGPGAARAFVTNLHNDEDYYRRRAANALVKLGPAATGPLLHTLAGPDERARALAVWVLGEMHAADATDTLLAALADENPGVREAALVALDKLGAAKHFDNILTRLTDESDFVRVAAVEVVGHLGNGRAAASITGRLDDPSPDVRRVAAETLGRLRDAGSARALLRTLTDEDHGVRYAAEQALAEIEKV